MRCMSCDFERCCPVKFHKLETLKVSYSNVELECKDLVSLFLKMLEVSKKVKEAKLPFGEYKEV